VKHERWASLGRQLWQRPRAHGEQPRERVVGPLELFYDLVVVVLVAQAAHHLAGHVTWAGLGEFTAVFTLVWIAWLNGSLHHELHGREDARSRSVFLLQILVLVPMGAFIPEAGGVHGAAFAVDTAILFPGVGGALAPRRPRRPPGVPPLQSPVRGRDGRLRVVPAARPLPPDARLPACPRRCLPHQVRRRDRRGGPRLGRRAHITDALTERARSTSPPCDGAGTPSARLVT